MKRESIGVSEDKLEVEACQDDKWLLKTICAPKLEEVALKCKELWLMQQVFRNVKSAPYTRLVCHRFDETIRGSVFYNSLTPILRMALDRRFE